MAQVIKKVVIYIKKNNRSNAQNAFLKQLKDIKDFCAAKGYEVCDSENIIGDREFVNSALLKMLKSAKEKGIKTVIMASTNNITGTTKELKRISKAFIDSGVTIETLDGSHTTDLRWIKSPVSKKAITTTPNEQEKKQKALRKQEYTKKFIKENYKGITLRVPIGKEKILKELSEEEDVSINQLIINGIERAYNVDLSKEPKEVKCNSYENYIKRKLRILIDLEYPDCAAAEEYLKAVAERSEPLSKKIRSIDIAYTRLLEGYNIKEAYAEIDLLSKEK